MNPPKTLAEKCQKPLNVSEYLWLQGKRHEIECIKRELGISKETQNHQANQIFYLTAAVMVLLVCNLALIAIR